MSIKILYAAFRHDPNDIMVSSGLDYFYYHSLKQQGCDVLIAGPYKSELLLEKLIRRVYSRIAKKKFIKYPFSTTLLASRTVDAYIKRWKPDCVFTIYPAPLVFLRNDTPCIFVTDTTFLGQQDDWPIHGHLGLRLSVWQEKQALRKSARILTYSEWSKNILISKYEVSPQKIDFFPMPSALPIESIPDNIFIKDITSSLKLLLVGKEYKRKGVDIAIEVAQKLGSLGMNVTLTICGLDGVSNDLVHFAGIFTKSNPKSLNEYLGLYKQAHLLIHPARFEAAGIVPSEAAAFGVPTITNEVGGLGTTVKHGVSGIVLPKDSHAQSYVEKILELVNSPERYKALCKSTRKRYEDELNWDVAGQKLRKILENVVSEATNHSYR